MWVTPCISSERTTDSAPICCVLFKTLCIVILLVSLFGVGEFFGGILAEVRLQEGFRLGQSEVEIGQRLDLEPKGTGLDVQQVSAVLAVL